MVRTVKFLIVGATFFGLGACGSTEPEPRPQLTVSPDPAEVLIGLSQSMSVRDLAGSQLQPAAVVWKSSAPGVANVSTNGVVQAIKAGTATITAASAGMNGSANISVVALALSSFVTGGAHTCGLTATGAAYCWGRGESGQLGVAAPSTLCSFDTNSLACSSVPLRIQSALVFTQLVAGGTHACGLTSDGTAYCWGLNASGQLGDNSTSNRFAPVAVATTEKFSLLAAGASYSCGVNAKGSAFCWGLNTKGQLGDGSTTNRLVPTAVSGGLAFTMLTAGGFTNGHTCGVSGGAGYCWGDNGAGQLGIGTRDLVPHSTPAAVTGGLTFSSIAAGLDNHTCALTAAGAAYCWGENAFGALGDGTTNSRMGPTRVSGGLAFSQIVAGGFIGHSCGLTTAGVAYCWGENEVGAIGDGTNDDALSPVPVAGGRTFSSLDAGFRHTCGRTMTGLLYCWGSGRAGQLGNNAVADAASPVKVIGQP